MANDRYPRAHAAKNNFLAGLKYNWSFCILTTVLISPLIESYKRVVSTSSPEKSDIQFEFVVYAVYDYECSSYMVYHIHDKWTVLPLIAKQAGE